MEQYNVPQNNRQYPDAYPQLLPDDSADGQHGGYQLPNTGYNVIPVVINPQQPMYPQQNGYRQQPAGNPAGNGSPRRSNVRRSSYRPHRMRGLKFTNGYAFSFGEENQPAVNVPTVNYPTANMSAPNIPAAGYPATNMPASGANTPYLPAGMQNVPMFPEAAQEQYAVPERQAAAESPSAVKLIRDSIMVLGMIVIFAVSAMVIFSSGIKQPEVTPEQKSFFEDLSAGLLSFKSDSLSAVFSIPKVYILPWGEQPAPRPNENGFGSYVRDDGIEVTTYEDETISVKYWMERQYSSNVHFADVVVAHPTQLRTAFAGGAYSDSVKYMPVEIARGVNAVIAINGDYCGYRTGGIIIRQNTVYRDTARGWDILLIDSDGDFHIMADSQVYPSGILEEYEIVNTLQFGPSLVVDGEINLINIQSGCGPTWNERRVSPRTAIGQIGRLHYLFCCVEGRSDESRGVYTSEMAQIMLDAGCVQAYNLDGGQSTTMILNGKAMNAPLWGSQRVVSDIIYCATAIPDEEATAGE